jgi:hypothetical protein
MENQIQDENEKLSEIPIEEELTSHEFAQGFNNAYLLGAHEPELLAEITQMVNPASEYFDGFFIGKQQWEQDQVRIQLDEMQQLRSINVYEPDIDR